MKTMKDLQELNKEELIKLVERKDIEMINLKTELKYNRIAVKYLRETNEHLLEMIKELKDGGNE